MNTIANNQQNINITPQRIETDHYQIASFSKADKIYDLTYNYDRKSWQCNCPVFAANCKHLILLRAHIKAEKAAQAPVQQHSSSAELIQVLERISHLEHAERSNGKTFENINYYLNIKEDQVIILQDKLGGHGHTIDQQAKQIADQRELIAALQTSVCRLNELTIKQDMQIQKLADAHDQLAHFMQEMMLQRTISDRLYEDQAQQIDKLTEQISAQAKPVEQVVRVVIDQPARQARAVVDMKVIRIGNECRVGKNTVPVIGNSAAGCDCSVGAKGQQCHHMVEVDKFLSK